MEEFLKLDIKKKFYYFMVMAALLLIMVIPVIMATTEKNVESNDIVLDDRNLYSCMDRIQIDRGIIHCIISWYDMFKCKYISTITHIKTEFT